MYKQLQDIQQIYFYMQKDFEFDKIIDKVEGFKGFALNSKMFLIGFIFHKYNLRTFQDCKILFQVISSLDGLLDQELITLKQKNLILQQIALFQPHQGQLSIKEINNELEQLIQICINDKINGTDYFMNKQAEDLDEKLIQQMLKADQEEKKKFLVTNQQSQRLAKKIQQEQQLIIRKKISESSKIRLNMDCPICLQTIQLKDLALLECSHSYHRICIGQTFKQAIDMRSFPLKCPNTECKIQASNSDIYEYLDEQYKTKFETYTFRKFVDLHHQDMSWCPSPGCTNVFIFEDDTTEFNCSVCHKIYCLKCKVEFHTGMSCKQFQINRVFDKNDQKFIQFVKGAKYKQCPNCNFWVQKNEGCDHMTCRCSFQFCYVCGGVYGNCECTRRRQPMPPPPPRRPMPVVKPIGKIRKGR